MLSSSHTWAEKRALSKHVLQVEDVATLAALIGSCAVVQISEDELQEALQAAVVCTILAKAGPQRSRILANLYKDERTHSLDLFPFMEKVYLERILRSEEVCCSLMLTLPLHADSNGILSHQQRVVMTMSLSTDLSDLSLLRLINGFCSSRFHIH
jgi:hypothetical protein